MRHNLLSGVRTYILVPAFFIFTLFLATVIIIYGYFKPSTLAIDRIIDLWAKLMLKIPPINVDVSGIELIDPERTYVVASNHLSMFDIPILFLELPLHGRFLSKKEMFKIPLVAQAMRTIGIIEIDRNNKTSTRDAISRGVKTANECGYSLLVFPEGTRSTNGELLPFKKGAFRIAIDTGVPLLPIVIEGTERASKPGSTVFYPGRARMKVLEPIETSNMTIESDLISLYKRVETEMNSVYNKMRSTATD